MIKSAVVFGVGYVLGTKAGRERYAQIRAVAQTAAARLEQQGRKQRERTTRS